MCRQWECATTLISVTDSAAVAGKHVLLSQHATVTETHTVLLEMNHVDTENLKYHQQIVSASEWAA